MTRPLEEVPVPHRMFTVTIKVGADSWEEAVREVERLADHIRTHGQECNMTSGGPFSGGYIDIRHDPEMTHDAYFAAIEARNEATRPAAEGKE